MPLTANLVLRFLLELFAFGSLAWWGFALPPVPLNVVVGIGAPVVAAVLWGRYGRRRPRDCRARAFVPWSRSS